MKRRKSYERMRSVMCCKVHLCNCKFVYLCICLFVHLCMGKAESHLLNQPIRQSSPVFSSEELETFCFSTTQQFGMFSSNLDIFQATQILFAWESFLFMFLALFHRLCSFPNKIIPTYLSAKFSQASKDSLNIRRGIS